MTPEERAEKIFPGDHGCAERSVTTEDEAAATAICRELYDRFMMGGWEPQDCHEYVRQMLRQLRLAK